MKKLLLASAFALAASTGIASATPLTGTFNISVWYGAGTGASGGATEQALPTNPIAAPGNLLYTGSYSGAINFSDGGINNIYHFLTSAGGTLSGDSSALTGHILSTGGFVDATVMEISFSTVNTMSAIITHDDGISIFDSTNTTASLDSSAPTSATPTALTDLAAGNYNLWYAEVNGVPAILDYEVTKVPEPVSLSLLGAGLAGLGLIRRRRSASV